MRTSLSRLGLALCAASALLLTTHPLPGQSTWPRQFTGDDGAAYTVYQPQVASWQGNLLKASAAVSVTPQGAAAPTFGTVTLTALTDVDKAAGTVDLSSVEAQEPSFPGAPGQAAQFAAQISTQAAAWGGDISLAALQANLAVTAAEGGIGRPVQVANDVPTIFFSEKPAVLVLIDGDPALRPVAGTNSLLRVINTQALLLMDKTSGAYYLRVNGGWTTASSLAGPWQTSPNPPASLAGVLTSVAGDKGVQLFDPPEGTQPAMPEIFASTTPAELLLTQGPPQFQPIPGSGLLYLSNSGSSILMNTADQSYYAAISGRWFRATSLNGPWAFVPANALPPDMANIPETHPAGAVLASVAGTPQANEAVISASIPQTARIERSASASAEYAGGSAQFEPISGTQLARAINSQNPVIRVDESTFFLVRDGVWFTATSADGPWTVADSIPASIYQIPPASPVFYATGVEVYSSDDDSVTFGYSPAYFGSYVVPEGVVVFGTGYNYVPYIGDSVWIGPPVTYGFGAGFACGLATGFAFGLAFDHGWGCMPWWGPWHGGWGYTNINVNRNWNNVNVNRQNIYNRWGNSVRVADNQFSRAQMNNAANRVDSNVTRNQLDNLKTNPDLANRADTWKDNHPDFSRQSQDNRAGLRDDDRQSFDRDSIYGDRDRIGDNNVFAGDDGNPYRQREDGGWDRSDGSGWSDAGLSRDSDTFRGLDREGAARSFGGFREGGGGFRGGGRR